MPVIAKRIVERREAKGWSQTELAEAISAHGTNVSPQNIQQLEAGDVKNPRYLLPLAKTLDISPEYALGESSTPARAEYESGFFTEDQITEATVAVLSSPDNRKQSPEIVAKLVISLMTIVQREKLKSNN